jgi:hypothetical protein
MCGMLLGGITNPFEYIVLFCRLCNNALCAYGKKGYDHRIYLFFLNTMVYEKFALKKDLKKVCSVINFITMKKLVH